MTSEGLGEMFEGDSADTCAGKFQLVPMGGRAEDLACADPGASGGSYMRRPGSERRVLRAQTRERGPPSALAEF